MLHMTARNPSVMGFSARMVVECQSSRLTTEKPLHRSDLSNAIRHRLHRNDGRRHARFRRTARHAAPSRTTRRMAPDARTAGRIRHVRASRMMNPGSRASLNILLTTRRFA
jgi:hypothetical protein